MFRTFRVPSPGRVGRRHAFTSCEYWTYLFVETFGSKRLRDATGDLMLGARAPLTQSLVLDIGLIDDVHKRGETIEREAEENTWLPDAG